MEKFLVSFDPIFSLNAKHDFNLLELDTLETRSRCKQVAEFQKIERGHRFDYINLLNQDLLNLLDSLQTMNRGRHFFIFNLRVIKHIDDRFQLKHNLLKPQLIRLVRDDKQHFIVSRTAHFGTFQFLCSKDFFELQVVAVVDSRFHK